MWVIFYPYLQFLTRNLGKDKERETDRETHKERVRERKRERERERERENYGRGFVWVRAPVDPFTPYLRPFKICLANIPTHTKKIPTQHGQKSIMCSKKSRCSFKNMIDPF